LRGDSFSLYGRSRDRIARAATDPERLDAFISQCHIATMTKIKTVCVYCGSGPGTNPRFIEAASAFGKALAENGVGLVYGGGSTGLMGAVAKSTLDHGGTVTGIIPEFLTRRENMLGRVQELVVTHDMHERKRLMFERSDAFVALPGGIGTLEELVEQLTWAQLGRHKKPVAILNVDFFWNPLLNLFDHMRLLGFIHSLDFFSYIVAEEVHDILPKLAEAVRTITENERHLMPGVADRL
jgi:uncharacterized protein (TIGR00730 family)